MRQIGGKSENLHLIVVENLGSLLAAELSNHNDY